MWNNTWQNKPIRENLPAALLFIASYYVHLQLWHYFVIQNTATLLKKKKIKYKYVITFLPCLIMDTLGTVLHKV